MTTLNTSPLSREKLNSDYVLLIGITAMLCSLGMAMVISASSVVSTRMTGNAWALSFKQFAALMIGLAFAFYLARVSLNQLKRLSIVYGVIVFVSLGAVLVIGKSVGGQKNWIDIAGRFNYQPSEFAKLALVLFGAWVFASGQSRDWTNKQNNILLGIVSILIIGLVLLEGDLGTPIILGGITLAIFYAHGARKRWLAAISATGALGQSTGKWGSLPAAHTDFILSVVGEELGIFGTVITLLLLIAFVFTALSIAFHSSDDFSRMAAFGIAGWFLVQTFINVGAIVQLVPITGVPLPFISYGGSSLIASIFSVGVLASLARNNAQVKRTRSRD